MKGDFTRITFQERKRYHQVLMQQGRVQLDQDWNEQMQILTDRLQRQVRDVVGDWGVPEARAGLGVSYDAALKMLKLTPGRAYVGGLLCEAFEGESLTLANQPFLPAPATGTPHFSLPADGVDRTDLVYVRAWERHVSAAEDPQLLEPALGGTDTTTRTQVVWQVRSAALQPGFSWTALTAPPSGRLSTQAKAVTGAGDVGYLPEGGTYRGHENRLYRVEVHKSGSRSQARFKWSRDNGSVAYRAEASGNVVQLINPGPNAFANLAVGQWVEVIDDEHEFLEGAGKLARIQQVSEATHSLELHVDVTDWGGTNCRIRRWDMAATSDDGAMALKPATAADGDWLDLELGIQVRFAEGEYRAGDYWVFTVRASGTTPVEKLTEAPPRGIAYQYAQVARVRWTWKNSKHDCKVEDLRPLFADLANMVGSGISVKPGDNFGLRLQKAIDGLPDGGVLTLPPGYFELEQPIAIRQRRRIAIRGQAGATRLFYNPVDANVAAITINGSADVELSGLSLYAQGARSLVQVDNTPGLRLRECRLANFGTEGVALGTESGITGLWLESCTLISAAGVVSAGTLQDLTLRDCLLRCLRAGVVAKAIKGLTLKDSAIASSGTNRLVAPSLTAEWIKTYEGGEFDIPLDAIRLPVGILTPEGESWAIDNVRIAAGIALGAFKLRLLNLRGSRINAVAGLLSLKGELCQITGSHIHSQTSGAIMAFGEQLNWRVTDSELSGVPHAIRFGLLAREGHWLSRLLTALNEGPGQFLLPADWALAGLAPTTYPTTTAGLWLVPIRLKAILSDDVLNAARALGATARAESIQIRHSGLTGVAVLEGCDTDKVEVTHNRFAGGKPNCAILIHGKAPDSGRFLIAHNTIDTAGTPMSLEVPGATITDNRITLLPMAPPQQNLEKLRLQFLNSADFVSRSLHTHFWTPWGTPFRSTMRRYAESDVEKGATSGLAADIEAAVAQYTIADEGKRLGDLFAQEYPPAADFAARVQAARTLAMWSDYTFAIMERPSIRVARTKATIANNTVYGDASAAGTISLDEPLTSSFLLPMDDIVVRDNRLYGMAGFGVASRPSVKGARIEDNQMENMGGIVVRESTDLTVSGNRVVLPTVRGKAWWSYDSAITVAKPAGRVAMTGNNLSAGPWLGVLVGTSDAEVFLELAGNTVRGYRDQRMHLVDLQGKNANAVLSHNHFAYTAAAETPTVHIMAKRASLIGNIWVDMENATPLLIDADSSYTALGNVSNSPILAKEHTTVQAQHNAAAELAYPEDPQILIKKPDADTTVSGPVLLTGTAFDRNASTGTGVSVVRLYLNGTEATGTLLGEADYDATTGTWSYTWDPETTNTPYEAQKVYVAAYSTGRTLWTHAILDLKVDRAVPNHPVVTFQTPGDGSLNMAGQITVSGLALDANAKDGIEKVEILVALDNLTFQPLDSVTPAADGSWSYEWSTGAADEDVTLRAIAHSTRGGAMAMADRKVNVHLPKPEDIVVGVASPGINTAVNGKITVTGTAYDPNAADGSCGVSRVIVSVLGQTTPAPVETTVDHASGCTWQVELDTSTLAGPHSLLVDAYSTVQDLWRRVEHPITVEYVGDPLITIHSPGVVYEPVLLTGTAVDRNVSGSSGVDLVRIYLNSWASWQPGLGPVALDTATGAWSFTLDPKALNLGYGTHSLIVTARRASDGYISVSSVDLQVAQAYPGSPGVAIWTPNETMIRVGTHTISGTARDENASGDNAGIQSVELFFDQYATETKLGDATLNSDGTWSLEWTNFTYSGPRTLIAVATSRRAGLKATGTKTVEIYSAKVSDVAVTMATPAANSEVRGVIGVTGQARDLTVTSGPGISHIALYAKDGVNPTPIYLQTKQPKDIYGNWGFTLDTGDWYGSYTLMVAAFSSEKLAWWNAAEVPIKVSYPGDPIMQITQAPTEILVGMSASQTLFRGYAFDRNTRTGHGIESVEVFEESSGGARTKVGQATLGLLYPPYADRHYGNCAWEFQWTPPSGSTGTYRTVKLVFVAKSAISGKLWTDSRQFNTNL